MDEHNRDLESLVVFLNFAKQNGYIKTGTANNRIRAVNAIFDIVQNVDTSDMTKVDLENLSSRYNVLAATKVRSATMRGNLDHLKGAIREFDRYLTDPANYSPESGRKKGAPSKAQLKKTAIKAKPAKSETLPMPDTSLPVSTQPILKEGSPMPSLHIDIQVHISPQASDSQIDKVFESMSRHLKDLYSSTKSTN